MHGAWCWECLVPLLEDFGHCVTAVELPGHASGLPAAEVTLTSYTEAVVAALETMPAPALLVGHSLGGLSVSAAAEFRPELVQALFYLCAAVPENGKALSAGTTNEELAQHIRSDDNGVSFYFADEFARDAFYGDCPVSLADQAMRRLVPQPLRPVQESIQLSADRYGIVPKHYLITLRDRMIPPPLQRAYATLAGEVQLHELDCGHSPFYPHPQELVTQLRLVARAP